MPQNPNDPKVKAFYTKQRQDAERAVAGGNAGAAGTLDKIGAKLEKSGDSKKRGQGRMDRSLATGGRNDGAVDNSMQTIGSLPLLASGGEVSGLMGAARGGAGIIKQLAEHPAAIEEVARAAGKMMARHLFPDAEETVAGVGRVGRRSAGAMKDVTPAGGRVGPQTALSKDPFSSMRSAGQANVKRMRADAKARAKAGSKPSVSAPVTARGQVQKALPKPTTPSPKMQHKVVKAGKPRALNQTARNKGTNPRAKTGYQRKTDDDSEDDS